jgi:hypothetical protein
MVGWAFLGICVLAALLIGGRALLSVDPRKLAKGLHYVLLSLILSAALFFMVTGRFAIGLGLGFFAVPYMRRVLFPSWAGLAGMFQFSNWSRSPGQAGAKNSNVETTYLKMTLSHANGEMDGEILQGKYSGKSLRDLSRSQLLDFYETCLIEDPEAATLMEAYLDRSFGPNWRDDDAGAGEDTADGASSRRRGWGKATNSQMSMTEARQVLGVPANASEVEIKEAHRRLMLKNHPDRGGSDEIATKINQAKDLLLGK